MATTPTTLTRTTLTATPATLYTVPAATTAVITNLWLANTSASAVTATISLDGVIFIPTITIAANAIATFDMRQPLAATKTITGQASVTSVLTVHVGGVQLT